MSSKGHPVSNKDEIFHSIQTGNLEQLKKLVNQENLNIKDRSGYTLLHVATNSDKPEIARWLVSIGADINIHCNGHTVLSSALHKANFDLFNFYLENRADCIGKNQLNILHEAANKNRHDIVEKLIDKGADPNQFNNSQITPLTIAINNRNKNIILLLLESGACANLPDRKGNTALHQAFLTGDSDIIDTLLENTECDLKLKNASEETPFDILWNNMIKEAKSPDEALIHKIIKLGGSFSMPWNFTFNPHNHIVFIRCISILCKYRLKDIFLNDRPLFTELIINGYWRNSLIVSMKSAIIDNKSSSSSENSMDNLYKSIETIILSGEFDLKESDLCSTFYMFDEVEEFEVYKRLKTLFSIPSSLKCLCRTQIRKQLVNLNNETLNELKISHKLKSFLLFESNLSGTSSNSPNNMPQSIMPTIKMEKN